LATGAPGSRLITLTTRSIPVIMIDLPMATYQRYRLPLDPIFRLEIPQYIK